MNTTIRSIPTKTFEELKNIKYKDLYYIGNLSLLKNKKVGIVGTRRPSSYTKSFTYDLARELTLHNIVVVSGTAMGVDIMAHRGAGANNTIAIVAHGVDIRYPKINSKDIEQIEQNGLILSTYPPSFKARAYTFIERNEIISAFCDVVVVSEAELKSGSLHTASFAIKYNKPLFVAPHRLNESPGTWELVNKHNAKTITNIKQFAQEISGINNNEIKDDFIDYCLSNPTYNQAVKIYKDKIFEYELLGKIQIINGKIFVI
jgi:DNA processing protein